MDGLTIKKTNIFFLIFMLSYVGMSIIVAAVMPYNTPMWASMLVSEAVIIAPVIVMLIAMKIKPSSVIMCNRIPWYHILLAYLAAYCLMPAVYMINYVTMFFSSNHVNTLVSELYRYPFAVRLVLLALLPAIVEEFIFRGVFYGSYRRRNVIGAAFMSGLCFGIAHMNINQFAYAFAIGIAFCIMYEAAGNILVPITAHFAINANTVFMTCVSEITAADIENAGEMLSADAIPTGMMIISMAFLAGISIIGLLFFFLIVRKMDATSAGGQHMAGEFKNFRTYGDESGGRFIDIYFIITVIPAVIYMIMLEM